MKDDNKSLARKERKQQKQKQKEEKYFNKYGVRYSEVKDKKEKTTLKYTFKMLRYLKGNVWPFLALIFILLVILAINTISPYFLSNLTDSVVAGDFNQAIIFACLYCIFVFTGPLSFLYDFIAQKLFSKLAHKMRLDLIKSTESARVEQFDKLESGKILSRINSDPANFIWGFSDILNWTQELLLKVARVGIFFMFSWKIGLFVLVAGFLVWFINRIFTKKVIVPADTRDSAINDKYNSQSTEMVRGIRDIKSLNIFEHFFKRFKQLSIYKRNSGVDAGVKDSAGRYFLGHYGLVDVVYIALLIFTITLISSGEISIGQFSVFLMYSWAALYLFPTLSQIQRRMYKMEVNARRMYEIIDDEKNPKEVFGDVVLQNAKGGIEFKDVCFSYKDEQVFDKLNLTIQPGQSVGFVGRSGEGKSTILNLIPRMYDVKSGEVLIDGVNNQTLTKESLRETVSVVPQSPYIFNMSIIDNLKLVNPTATQEQIEDACKRAAILDFIKSRPEGFNAMVGEGGVVLSGGQKQRLAIARAFLKKSKILLFDEATSALDNESQEEIKKAIKNMQKTCTIVIVAHRLSTVKDCDKIFVLDNHKIVGEGKHEDLMKNCKAYKNLYKQEEKQ